MSKGSCPSIAPAVGRRLIRAWCFGVLMTSITFGVVASWGHHVLHRRATVQEAQLVAALLSSGRNGDLSESFERMRSRTSRLLAVAALDGSAHLERVVPEQTAERGAMNVVVERLVASNYEPGDAAVVHAVVLEQAEESGGRVAAEAVVVPMNGVDSPSSRHVVVLLRDDFPLVDWLRALGVFAIPFAFFSGLGLYSLSRWFEREVVSPLRSLTAAVDDPGGRHPVGPKVGSWRETTVLAEQFEELLVNLAKTDARNRRLQRDVERERREREATFQRELRRAEDRAHLDTLTKLRNRAFLEEKLEAIFTQHRDDNRPFSAVVLDLDNFKQHNDTHGHQAGDALLRFVGTLLQASIRPGDFAVRHGGDEFLLLLSNADTREAKQIADRLVKLFAQYAGKLREKTNVSISAGVASLRPGGAASGHELVASADAALYAAKRGGKNMVSIGTGR